MRYVVLALLLAGCAPKAADPVAATPAATGTPLSQFGADGDLLGQPAIESSAIDVAGRLGYHAAVVDSATYDASAGSWLVKVSCGNREHQKTELSLWLDARTGLVRQHRGTTSTARDSCAVTAP